MGRIPGMGGSARRRAGGELKGRSVTGGEGGLPLCVSHCSSAPLSHGADTGHGRIVTPLKLQLKPKERRPVCALGNSPRAYRDARPEGTRLSTGYSALTWSKLRPTRDMIVFAQ